MSAKKMLAIAASVTLIAAAAPAFASNPFSDVPLNHWAYDAVETLSAKGIIDGYPDNTFRGSKVMTRYEIASMIARAMNSESMDESDTEQLKSLIVEFSPELEAIGVKVESFDKRLSALEDGVSGWKIWGQMRFDYKNMDYSDSASSSDTGNNRTGFDMNRARLFMSRELGNGITYQNRWHNDKLDYFWLTARNFLGTKGLTAKIGQFNINWEGEDQLWKAYTTVNDAWLLDAQLRGIQLTYDNGTFQISVFGASNKGAGDYGAYTENKSGDYYGGRLKFNFNEKLWLSLNAFWQTTEGETSYDDWEAYWAVLGYNFGRGCDLELVYYTQQVDHVSGAAYDDDPQAYRVLLKLSQDVLKYTSLWAEYGHMDEGFVLHQRPYAYNQRHVSVKDFFGGSDDRIDGDTDLVYLYAQQKWTKKFSTIQQYYYADMDDANSAYSWTFGIGYQYTPAVYFELSYTDQDGKLQDPDYEEKFIMFRTLFNF